MGEAYDMGWGYQKYIDSLDREQPPKEKKSREQLRQEKRDYDEEQARKKERVENYD